MKASHLSSFPALDHDDMIAMARFRLSILRVPGRTSLQLKSHGLEGGIEASPSLPAKRAAYKESVSNPSYE
jgi:hypothetical protein